MRVDIVAPAEVAAGTPVSIAIRIANTADHPIELHLQGRTTVFDLIVSRRDSVVWRRLEGKSVPAILQLRTLAPGEVLELKDSWPQRDNGGRPAGPGEYTVVGSVATDGAPLRTGPTRVRIEE